MGQWIWSIWFDIWHQHHEISFAQQPKISLTSYLIIFLLISPILWCTWKYLIIIVTSRRFLCWLYLYLYLQVSNYHHSHFKVLILANWVSANLVELKPGYLDMQWNLNRQDSWLVDLENSENQCFFLGRRRQSTSS